MAEDLQIRYILLKYVGESESENGRPVAVLSLTSLPDGTGHLDVYTRPGWDKEYPEGEQLQLAMEILSDWEQIDSRDAPSIFHDLLDASFGPLLIEKDGSCAPNELETILRRELRSEN
jgi:hypothetical protein